MRQLRQTAALEPVDASVSNSFAEILGSFSVKYPKQVATLATEWESGETDRWVVPPKGVTQDPFVAISPKLCGEFARRVEHFLANATDIGTCVAVSWAIRPQFPFSALEYQNLEFWFDNC